MKPISTYGLLDAIVGILSSYCISIVKKKKDNINAYICYPSVVAYVSFDSSLPQTLHWSQTYTDKKHILQFSKSVCCDTPIKERVLSSYPSSLWPYILYIYTVFSLHFNWPAIIGCQRMMNWRDTPNYSLGWNGDCGISLYCIQGVRLLTFAQDMMLIFQENKTALQ